MFEDRFSRNTDEAQQAMDCESFNNGFKAGCALAAAVVVMVAVVVLVIVVATNCMWL